MQRYIAMRRFIRGIAGKNPCANNPVTALIKVRGSAVSPALARPRSFFSKRPDDSFFLIWTFPRTCGNWTLISEFFGSKNHVEATLDSATLP